MLSPYHLSSLLLLLGVLEELDPGATDDLLELLLVLLALRVFEEDVHELLLAYVSESLAEHLDRLVRHVLLHDLDEAIRKLVRVLGERGRLVSEAHLAEVDEVRPDGAEVREGLHELLGGDILVLPQEDHLDGKADNVVLDLRRLINNNKTSLIEINRTYPS